MQQTMNHQPPVRAALGDVSNRNQSTATKKAAPATPAVVAVTPDAFLLTPTTCVPSLLHYLTLSHYAPDLMERGIYTCGQLYTMPYELLRPYFTSDEDCQKVVSALHAKVERITSVRSHNPYKDNVIIGDNIVAQQLPSPVCTPVLPPLTPMFEGSLSMDSSLGPTKLDDPPVEDGPACTCLVHFKFRQTEYSAPFPVKPGQYVVVGGDRGQDLGLVIRVNTDEDKGYVERTGPQGTVSRAAYQKEVEYFNGSLRMDELAAADICRARVARLGLNMEVHYAEFQYDKKKLTFYYESRARVDFVALLKDLYREFGCRIWMEKVPRNNVPLPQI